MEINFIIEGPPVGKARPRVTRTVTYTPAKTARYEDLGIISTYVENTFPPTSG